MARKNNKNSGVVVGDHLDSLGNDKRKKSFTVSFYLGLFCIIIVLLYFFFVFLMRFALCQESSFTVHSVESNGKTEPLEGVEVSVKHHQSLYEQLIYPSYLYKDSIETDESGKATIVAPLNSTFLYKKQGYHFLYKNPVNGIVCFQKNIDRLVMQTRHTPGAGQNGFSYIIRFYKGNEGEGFLKTPNDTLLFTDTINTKIDKIDKEYISTIVQNANCTNFVGEVSATAEILPNSENNTGRHHLIHHAMNKINIQKIKSNNVLNPAVNYKNDNFLLKKEKTRVKILKGFDAETSHKINFTYTLSRNDISIVIEFMGVEFVIGLDGQNTIFAQPNTFNDVIVTPKLLSNNVLSERLNTELPVNVGIYFYRIDADNYFEFTFTTHHKERRKPFNETLTLEVVHPALDIGRRQINPVSIYFIHNKTFQKNNFRGISPQMRLCDFSAY